MMTVPEAARFAGRDPETIRRWIRSGKLRASKVGTQHVIEQSDLEELLYSAASLSVPASWRRFESGRPQPDWVAAMARSRSGR
jgi:excisionase family DNA binding protein